ncbi:hypothetical protein INR49_012200 [Caranx melampygus]|nr:hypothetical protein INR49_012200 [Caranx melampygus]
MKIPESRRNSVCVGPSDCSRRPVFADPVGGVSFCQQGATVRQVCEFLPDAVFRCTSSAAKCSRSACSFLFFSLISTDLV